MCLISTEIESVSNTKIFVAPNADNTRQLVIYSNYVNNVSGETNAMVLPVPLPQTIKFIDLSNYKNLFEDCAKCFYNPAKNLNFSTSYSTNSFNLRGEKPLQVFNVGSYKVSLAKNLEQIQRVDPKIFKLSSGLKQTLETFYYQPYWGFIVCKLNSGPESYHPFAYSHQIIDSKIYIPTRHYHQEVKWANVNNWALGTHLDPKQNPLNAKNWTDENINMSPMFRTEQFGPTSPEANGWVNAISEIGEIGGFNEYGDDFSSNQFSTPNNKFDKPTQPHQHFTQSTQSNLKLNSIAQMSTRYDNLKKLNDSNHKKSSSTSANLNVHSNTQYKNIADDWSHSIYLLNLNPKSSNEIVKMNSCKEIWDKQTLFDPEKIDFDFGYCKGFSKIKIEGTYSNIDLVLPVLPIIPISTTA